MTFKLLNKQKLLKMFQELSGKVITSDLMNGDETGDIKLNNRTYHYEVLDYKPNSIRYVIIFINSDGSLVLIPESVWNKRGTKYGN